MRKENQFQTPFMWIESLCPDCIPEDTKKAIEDYNEDLKKRCAKIYKIKMEKKND